jgi:hypothetical protein
MSNERRPGPLPEGASRRENVRLTTRSRVEEKLGEWFCQNGLKLGHDRLDVGRYHMSIESGFIGPALEEGNARACQ